MNLNKIEEWAVNQTLGAGSAQNIPLAIRKRVGAMIQADPTLTKDKVTGTLISYVDEMADKAFAHGNPFAVFIAVRALNALIPILVDAVYAAFTTANATQNTNTNPLIGNQQSA